jgi:hypothetical protein
MHVHVHFTLNLRMNITPTLTRSVSRSPPKKSLENIEWDHIVHVHVRVFRTSTCECLMSFNVVNLLSDSYSIDTVS